MKKVIIYLGLALVMLVSLSQAQWKFGPFVEVVYQPTTINHMPYTVRYVPIHKEDDYVDPANAGPIAKELYKTNWLILLGVETKTSIFSDYYISARLSFSFNKSDEAERNYTNAVGTGLRGYDAALTYCWFHIGSLVTALSKSYCSADVAPEFLIERNLVKNLSIGTSIMYLVVSASNGWDRWDNYEENKTYLLAHCLPVTLFLKYEIDQFNISAGVSIANYFLTDLGKKADYQQDKAGLMIGLTFFQK